VVVGIAEQNYWGNIWVYKEFRGGLCAECANAFGGTY
jgi:hypothetical protein